ncbi:MAG TPA: hypothetical protein VF971_08260 [Candidatus Limnocylindrales bacterium]
MIRLDPTWPVGGVDPRDDRNRMHLVAIREARLDAEQQPARHATVAVAPNRRIALAPAGATSNIDLCAACA